MALPSLVVWSACYNGTTEKGLVLSASAMKSAVGTETHPVQVDPR